MTSVHNENSSGRASGKHNLGDSALIDRSTRACNLLGRQFRLLANCRCFRPQQEVVHGDHADQRPVFRDYGQTSYPSFLHRPQRDVNIIIR